MNNERAAEIVACVMAQSDLQDRERWRQFTYDEYMDALTFTRRTLPDALLEVTRLRAEVDELVEVLSIQVIATVAVEKLRDIDNFPALLALVKHGRVTKTGDRYEWRKP